MGKINLNAMKQARKEQEIETPVPEALEQAYANVWGKDKETVQYIELNHIVPFADREGEHSLSKSLRKRYLKSSCLPLTSAL